MKCDACILFLQKKKSLVISWDNNVFLFVNFLGLVVFPCSLGSGGAHVWRLCVHRTRLYWGAWNDRLATAHAHANIRKETYGF